MIYPTPLQVPEVEIRNAIIENAGVRVIVRREDLNHPLVSGNKYWKLKYNLLEALKLGHDTVLTFGGAFSNHIAATAAACKIMGLESIGIIRGEEVNVDNPTLGPAKANGMLLHPISRTRYREKATSAFLGEMESNFGEFYLIPEGGTNALAIAGAMEMTQHINSRFDYLALPVGTGGTITGCINQRKGESNILGFSSLNGGFLADEISLLQATDSLPSYKNWVIHNDYHFGGYAKTTPELFSFIDKFEKEFNIPLDPVYTGKMMFGILDLIQKKSFKEGAVILALHTGGIQGKAGFLKR